MNTKSGLILTFLMLSLTAVAAKDPVIATVNGTKILKSLFDQEFRQNLLFVSDKPVTKEKVLNDIINRELGIKKAKKAKLDKDPVVRRKMEEILYHAQISKDLEGKLAEIKVSDSEVESYYKSNPEYRTAHILFRTKAAPEKDEVMAAQQKALEKYTILKKSPEKFSEFANKYSQSSTAPNGGDMGFQPAIRLAPEYFEAIKGKRPNTITPPVRTQFGYHIIKILAVKDIKSINTALYKKVVYDQKRDKILEDYFSAMRKSAKIDINKKVLNDYSVIKK
jgi:parvulin-like peptidyl-prolyl isomerase